MPATSTTIVSSSISTTVLEKKSNLNIGESSLTGKSTVSTTQLVTSPLQPHTTTLIPATSVGNTILLPRNDLFEESPSKNKKICECSICRQKTNTETHISGHMQEIHQSKNEYQCSNCTFTSTIMNAVVAHASAKHPSKVPELRVLYYKDRGKKENELVDTTSFLNRNCILLEQEENEDTKESLRSNDLIIISDDDSSTNQRRFSIIDLCDQSAIDSDIEITSEFMISHKSTLLGTKSKLVADLRPEHDLILTDDPTLSKKKSSDQIVQNKKPTTSLEQFNKRIKYICYYCPDSYYDEIEILLNHYNTVHTVKYPKSFRFKINKIFKCNLCPYKDIYRNIEKHYKSKHSGLPVVTRDAFENFKCGLCSFRFNGSATEQTQHYLTEHSKTQRNETVDQKYNRNDNEEPKNYLTDEFLDELLFHTEGYGEKFFCEICFNIFKNMHEYSEHHNKKHGPKTKNWSKPCIRYACLICAPFRNIKIFTNRQKILKHFDIHHSWTFPSDEGKFGTESNFFTKMQTIMDNNIEIIFPNGLTIKKCEAKFTKYYNWSTILIPKSNCHKSSEILRYNSSDYNIKKTRNYSGKRTYGAATSVKEKESDTNLIPVTEILSENKLPSENDHENNVPLAKKLKVNNKYKKNNPGEKESDSSPYKIDLTRVYTKMNLSGNDIYTN